MNTLNNWGPAAIIVFGYLIGVLYQTHYVDKRFDELTHYVDKRFDDLYRYLDVRFGAIEHRLDMLEEKMGVKS